MRSTPVSDVCGSPAYDLKFEGGGGTDIIYTIRLRCGQYLDGIELKECATGQIGEAIEVHSHPDCQPVPEPGIVLGIFVGCLVLAILSRRRF